MTDVVGVDAARSLGWAAVALRDGRLHQMSVHASLQEVGEVYRSAEVVAVDIPIGHEDPAGLRDAGRRQADASARAYLGARRQSSLFWVPPPAVLEAADQTEAVLLCRRNGWIAPSAQLWALKPRLLEAQRVARDRRFYEVHPEVSFQTLLEERSPGARLEHAKSTWAGLVERLELLHAVRLRPERSLGGIGRAGPDDVLDATIAAWTAWRIAQKTATTLPASPPSDPATGRPVAIWV